MMRDVKKPKDMLFTQMLYNKASRRMIPLSGTFELSPVCNFSCRMCYVRKTQKEVRESPRKILTLEQWLVIAREAREQGMLFLLLTGGEPLLWPDFWTLYEALIQMGFLVSINTNGSLIDDAAIARFRKLPPYRINLTLYGASDVTYERLCGVRGCMSQIAHSIESLQENDIRVKLNCSLTPYNINDLEDFVSFSKERKLVLDTATYMFPPIRRDPTMLGVNDRFTPEETAKHRIRCYKLVHTPAQYQTFLQSIVNGYVEPPSLDEYCVDPIDGKIRCRAGNAAFWITWDGWLTPCGLMNEPKVDLTADGFTESWKKLTKLSSEVTLSGICTNCGNQTICHPCAAMAQAETGTSSGIPQYLCRAAQEMKRIATMELEHS